MKMTLHVVNQFGIRSFSQFHSIDAQDLIKVYETFSNKQLSSKFRTWFEDIRILRNKFMHTVDKNSEITPELIFKCIVYAHNELNQNDDHWIWHRFKYKSKHSGEGIDFNTDNDIPGEIFEMIQVHYELLGALNACSREMANELFNFDINSERFYCVECLDVMVKNEYFDSRHLDYCIETVQKNKRTDNYQCVFCNEEYKEIPDSMWKDE